MTDYEAKFLQGLLKREIASANRFALTLGLLGFIGGTVLGLTIATLMK